MTGLCHLAADWRGDVPAGGWLVEQKWDGWRCLYFRGIDGQPRLWTRQGMPIDGAAQDSAEPVEALDGAYSSQSGDNRK